MLAHGLVEAVARSLLRVLEVSGLGEQLTESGELRGEDEARFVLRVAAEAHPFMKWGSVDGHSSLRGDAPAERRGEYGVFVFAPAVLGSTFFSRRWRARTRVSALSAAVFLALLDRFFLEFVGAEEGVLEGVFRELDRYCPVRSMFEAAVREGVIDPEEVRESDFFERVLRGGGSEAYRARVDLWQELLDAFDVVEQGVVRGPVVEKVMESERFRKVLRQGVSGDLAYLPFFVDAFSLWPAGSCGGFGSELANGYSWSEVLDLVTRELPALRVARPRVSVGGVSVKPRALFVPVDELVRALGVKSSETLFLRKGSRHPVTKTLGVPPGSRHSVTKKDEAEAEVEAEVENETEPKRPRHEVAKAEVEAEGKDEERVGFASIATATHSLREGFHHSVMMPLPKEEGSRHSMTQMDGGGLALPVCEVLVKRAWVRELAEEVVSAWLEEVERSDECRGLGRALRELWPRVERDGVVPVLRLSEELAWRVPRSVLEVFERALRVACEVLSEDERVREVVREVSGLDAVRYVPVGVEGDGQVLGAVSVVREVLDEAVRYALERVE